MEKEEKEEDCGLRPPDRAVTGILISPDLPCCRRK